MVFVGGGSFVFVGGGGSTGVTVFVGGGGFVGVSDGRVDDGCAGDDGVGRGCVGV